LATLNCYFYLYLDNSIDILTDNLLVATRDVEAAMSSTASTPIASATTASASTNKKRENDRWP